MTGVGKAILFGAALQFATAANGEIIWDQAPGQSAGLASDTDFTYYLTGQQHYWSTGADNFQLSADATATQVVWWGFYFLSSHYPPPTEAFRIRFYGARSTDGLPDDTSILYEQTVQNQTRQATGQIMPVGNAAPEFKYTANLTTPASLLADTKYWLSIAQIGDPATDFYWETGWGSLDGIADANPHAPNWNFIGPPNDLAFQLLTPEPLSAAGCLLMCVNFGFIAKRRRRRDRKASADGTSGA